jgi:XTP/dITP diphosphohydrolase
VERLKARLASRNVNKARELERLLPGWEIELLGADEFPPEEGETYNDNARAKALFGRAVAEPDVWVLGEDSGIEVDGLGGGPGIESARSGGEDPVGWLLERLSGIEEDGRRARYVCELVCVSPEHEELRGTGTLEGRIGYEPRGGEGFGFDPIFIPHGLEQTVAELGNDWKAEHSHRAKAAKALLHALSAPHRIAER